MPEVRIPIGGYDGDLDSIKSRVKSVNMTMEIAKDYMTLRGCDGLDEALVLPLSPLRSNFEISRGGNLYMVAGSNLYQIEPDLTVTDLGYVGGAGKAQILTNGVPGDNQLLILNGIGEGYTYSSVGLAKITDANFPSCRKGAVLNEIFWVVVENSNQIKGSAVSDGTTWPTNRVATAEESPDKLINIKSKGSKLYLMGSRTTESWIASSDVNVPIRVQKGATIERGVLAINSVAETAGTIAWLADDKTVLAINNGSLQKISDLDLEQTLKGNGTTQQPKPATVEDAVGFFEDSPTHKVYHLSFPTAGFTWSYDFSTGMTFTRESLGKIWRVDDAVLWNGTVYGADRTTGQIWEFSPSKKTEGSDAITRLVQFPPISNNETITINRIEMVMEVGQVSGDSLMTVKYSKDGGNTFKTWGEINLGALGNYKRRIVLRRFGQLVKHKDFVLQLSVTDPVRVQLYESHMYAENGFG